MNSLKHIIYNIRTLIKDVHSDDIKFTDRNIAYWIKYLRVKLIRQDYEKNRSISDNIKQEISVDVESIDIGTDKGIETGEFHIKSKLKIPKFISAYQKDLILDIKGIDDNFDITVQTKAKALKNRDSKYGQKFPVAYLDKGYLYIVGCNFYIENVNITGVFNDPEEVDKFNNPLTFNEDDFYDKDYPIEDHMIDMINSIIKSNELNLYFQLSEDKLNDSQTNSL